MYLVLTPDSTYTHTHLRGRASSQSKPDERVVTGNRYAVCGSDTTKASFHTCDEAVEGCSRIRGLEAAGRRTLPVFSALVREAVLVLSWWYSRLIT